MNRYLYIIIIITLVIIVAVLGYKVSKIENTVDCNNPATFVEQRFQLDAGFQTSARYLNKLAKLDACEMQSKFRPALEKNTLSEQDQEQLQEKLMIFAITKDIEIKASSYAFLNKVFFWISLFLAICIIVIPVTSTLVKDGSKLHKIMSPAQLPAITLLAGLCFSFYADYKGKQTSAENLIRYAYFSNDPIKKISSTVRTALSEIDSGQDFYDLIKD